MEFNENEIFYGCTSCGMEVTEDEYLEGFTTCTDEDCDRYGQPLERLQYCAQCGEYYPDNDADKHMNCQ